MVEIEQIIEQIRNAFKGFIWIIFGVILWLFASYEISTYTSYSSIPLAIYDIVDCLYIAGILIILYGILSLGSVFTIRENRKAPRPQQDITA